MKKTKLSAYRELPEETTICPLSSLKPGDFFLEDEKWLYIYLYEVTTEEDQHIKARNMQTGLLAEFSYSATVTIPSKVECIWKL